ncbi:hypothetical protein PBI_VALIDUS_102 [Mycobacterium phage Validus]|uniref:Uncharacterized protein n=1 Tax=Mycobacterium phage Validus TaxID=1414747 RepID=V5URS6_9CAUD|nr:hypothetical protein CC50_gp009 [Mycobacterium phage Validus]AHB79632.1 hypothetical protein PBI_VALIDUS_102 [Mycobacterium phage Validus]
MTATATATIDTTYIARDTYTGRWMVTHKTDARLGRRTAAFLADMIGEGNTGVIWEYAGRTHTGRHLFVRTRFVARGGALVGYDSDGVCKVVHPADRVIGFIMAAE